MLNRKYGALKIQCEKVLSTGDTEHDFRSRIVAGLALLLLASTSVLVVDDFLAGYPLHAALLAIIPLGCIGALWCLFVRYNLDRSASVLIGTVFSVLSLVLLLSGGSAAGVFVALPVIVLLASVLCSRKVAVAISVGTLGAVGLVVWCAANGYAPLLFVEKNPIWMLGRVTILISLITMIAMFLYRDSAEHVRNQAVVTKEKLEAANAELSSVLSSQLASAKLLFKVQEIGDLTGWWYEPSVQTVHYTTTEQTVFESVDIRQLESENCEESPGRLSANFRAIIKARLESAESWDDETKIGDGSGSVNWYRDSGEVEKIDGTIVRVVGVLQDITSTKTLTDQLEIYANYDELTGLCNRRMFWKAAAAEHAIAQSGGVSAYLLFIDLDQFKLVNDNSGHAAGDRLLKTVAGALRDNVHDTDVVSRVGGDEFGVILRNCQSHEVESIAERLRRVIEKIQFRWDGESFRVSASIGVIAVSPRHGSADELQQLVDAACYEAKIAGRNRVNFFEGEEEVIAAHRGEARWVQRLHDAMDHDRFELHCQRIKPVMDSLEPERYEVLLRLKDTDSDRLVPPGAFLPAAERFGLAPQVDEWVLTHLIERLAADPAISEHNCKYWVNLSGNSIGDRQFADFLIETMRQCTLPRGMVNFEITETAVIRNIDDAGELLSKLRDMGCQLALDDFGSGLSSFGYLKELPVDFVKIDGMFVREILNDEADRVFVRAIISIAHAIGVKTVAEFVENDEIYQLVKEFGVDYVQGYGIHRPEKLAFYGEPSHDSLDLGTTRTASQGVDAH